jgi:hypothetical protein
VTDISPTGQAGGPNPEELVYHCRNGNHAKDLSKLLECTADFARANLMGNRGLVCVRHDVSAELLEAVSSVTAVVDPIAHPLIPWEIKLENHHVFYRCRVQTSTSEFKFSEEIRATQTMHGGREIIGLVGTPVKSSSSQSVDYSIEIEVSIESWLSQPDLRNIDSHRGGAVQLGNLVAGLRPQPSSKFTEDDFEFDLPMYLKERDQLRTELSVLQVAILNRSFAIEAALEVVRSSRSWKVTAPLRALRRRLFP